MNAIETVGRLAGSGSLVVASHPSLAGACRERCVLAQVDEASAGRAGQPGAAIAGHREAREGSDDRDLKQCGEGRVAHRSAEGGSLRVIVIADEAHVHGRHAGGAAGSTEHDSGGNHGLDSDERDSQGREVDEPRRREEYSEDEHVDDVSADEPRGDCGRERSLCGVRHYRTALQANRKRPEDITAAGRSAKVQKV